MTSQQKLQAFGASDGYDLDTNNAALSEDGRAAWHEAEKAIDIAIERYRA